MCLTISDTPKKYILFLVKQLHKVKKNQLKGKIAKLTFKVNFKTGFSEFLLSKYSLEDKTHTTKPLHVK